MNCIYSDFDNDCLQLRRLSPLVLCLTNYVAVNLNANALLAAGASPIMSFDNREIEELATHSGALCINIGCVTPSQEECMRIAASRANELGIPWVIDPVGAGASALRTDLSISLIEKFKPSVIRGNASEVMVLAGLNGNGRGVDSSEDCDAAKDAAVRLANCFGAVVSVSGSVDLVTDGKSIVRIGNGSQIMPKVTGMGCTASALTGAFLAAVPDHFAAAVDAMILMGLAGEAAAAQSVGSGSFQMRFIDCLSPEAYGAVEKKVWIEII